MGKNYNLYDKVVAAALTEVFNYTKDSQYMYFPTEWKYKYSDGPFFLAITKIAQSMNHKPIVVQMSFLKFLFFKKKNNKLILKRKHKVDTNDFLPLEKIGNNIIENFNTSQLIFYEIYDEYYKENK